MKRLLSFALLVAGFGALMTWMAIGDRPAAFAEDTAGETTGFKSAWASISPEVLAQSEGCLNCHDGVEKMHGNSPTVKVGCADCHGGNPKALKKDEAHVLPRHPDRWPGSANPKRSYAALNNEKPDFVQFINPGDLRIVHKTCGKCHEEDVMHVRKSIMTHSAMVPGSAAYNNGLAPIKNYAFGESYHETGYAQTLKTVPPPTPEELKRGVLPALVPIPDFARTFPGNPFRVFEDGNNGASVRGPGTEFRIEAGFLAISKTRLNDPYLSFMGTNDYPGDYRSSGCSACHVIYANDRDETHSAQWAQYGNTGFAHGADPMIPKNEPGHPIKHQLTRSIPSSQCITCHHHQGSGASISYLGYYWWDYESDADQVYKNGKFDENNFGKMKELSAKFPRIRFADHNGHGWFWRAVYKQDIRGNLLDQSNQVVDLSDPQWDQKAVHLKDIHAEKGLHCIDCHFKQDSHGDGKLYGEMINAVEIACNDCHGIYTGNDLVTSNPPGGNKLDDMRTPWGKKAIFKRGRKVFQRSRIHEDKEWEIPQQADHLDPTSDNYNEKMALAHTIQRDGKTWGPAPGDLSLLAHRTVPLPGEADMAAHTRKGNTMTCYSCHTSWVTNCYGCHLPNITNIKKDLTHYWGEATFNDVKYYPQTLRTDGFNLGINGSVKGNRVSPVRSASAVVASAQNGNREWVFFQNPTISAEGFSGHAFTPYPPHTVRKDTTKQCTDCHVSAENDNNARLANLIGLGSNGYDFIGRYAYVASGSRISAVQVAEGLFPEPVIGSQYHSVMQPETFKKHVSGGRKLKTAHKHRTKAARSIQKYFEYLFVADGPNGVRIFDVANIANKGFAQRLIEEPFSNFGHSSRLPSKDARSIAFASILPIDPERSQRPENLEQTVSKIFGYAYVADAVEGLLVYDILTYIDGNPRNNFPKRQAALNPDGALSGASNLKIAGNYAYVLTRNGMAVVDISSPTEPKIAAQVGSDQLKNPKSISVQFRYAFVVDDEGLKVFDVTALDKPQLVSGATVAIEDARDVFVCKTFAYVAAGRNGLVIVDITKPESPQSYKTFNAEGRINDASAVVIGMTNVSLFAYVADGRNGLRVIQLISSKDPGHLGYAPYPENPQLIATCETGGRAVAISQGLPRDRYVDESGNQIGVFGRLGSRPFSKSEIDRLYLREGKVWSVSNSAPGPRSGAAAVKTEEKKKEKKPKRKRPGRKRPGKK